MASEVRISYMLIMADATFFDGQQGVGHGSCILSFSSAENVNMSINGN